MTQTQTQTTAVLVESILETELHLIPLMVGVDDDSAEIGGMDAAARIIAAEIDGLARERDEAQRLIGIYSTSRDAVIAQLGTEIDALTADNAQANQWLVNGVAKIERLEKERDEARAEVERLRPAAEAWEKAEVANAANANRMSLIMDAAAYRSAKVAWVAAQEQADAAAARARAAKEAKA